MKRLRHVIYQNPSHKSIFLGETKNRCISSFREANGNTIWHMDVHFQFEADEGQDKKVFMKKTEEDMMAFKTYVEGL